MAAESQLQATAHRHTVDGRDHGFGGVLNGHNHRQEVGILISLGATEFFDVCTAREGFASARQNDRLDCRIGVGLLESSHDAEAS